MLQLLPSRVQVASPQLHVAADLAVDASRHGDREKGVAAIKQVAGARRWRTGAKEAGGTILGEHSLSASNLTKVIAIPEKGACIHTWKTRLHADISSLALMIRSRD